MKRILVTGGAGFLGSHLCERLAKAGNYVICLDNFFTGRRETVAHLPVDQVEVVRHDVCDPFHFEVDEIYHLACPASPVHYQRNPARTVKTAVIGTANALDCARDTGAKIFIASTSEVYGDPLEHPQTESYWGNVNPIGPRANYDEGKRCGETLAVSYLRQYSTQVRIARIFNCYGPRMLEDDGRVVSSFVCQALRNDPLTVFGDGTQTRSFIFVDDLIDGFLKLMDAGYVEPVNLGNPNEFTVLELAEKVIAMVGQGRVEYRQLPKDDPARRKPDITRAKRLLNWEPKVSLSDGLAKTIEYFRGRVKLPFLPYLQEARTKKAGA